MQNRNKLVAAVVAGAVGLSAGGLALIAGFEGKRNEPYRDIVGVWTVCYGSTGAHVLRDGRRTDGECAALLREDAVRFEAAVLRCSAPAVLNQNQFDALTSFAFNVGENAYCRSTMSRKVRASDFVGAAAEFPKWSYADRKLVRGLQVRRLAEQRLFVTPMAAPARSTDAAPPVVVIRDPAAVERALAPAHARP